MTTGDDRPIPQPRRSSVAIASLLFLCVGAAGARPGSPRTPELELVPRHFVLHPGEQIHYQVLERSGSGKPRFADAEFAVENPAVVRLVERTGKVEALASGRTALVVRTPTAWRRVTVKVEGRPQPAMVAVPHSTVREIVAKELLFVGHANLDGFDHTAVAKAGIDRLVQQARTNSWTVVYWISEEYPDWYTADRHPDYAIISEGQEHQIRVDAQRVMFAGGSFMFCLLRNAQMTLHGMLTHDDRRRIDFMFPARAIWVEDIWGPGDKRPYPASMVLLTTLFACAVQATPTLMTTSLCRSSIV